MSWIRSSYKNPAEGVEMAPERAWKISARDWKWTESPETWHGLQLAQELPKPSSNNSSYWATAAWSSVLSNPALPNRNCSQQVIVLYFPDSKFSITSKTFLYLIKVCIWLCSSKVAMTSNLEITPSLYYIALEGSFKSGFSWSNPNKENLIWPFNTSHFSYYLSLLFNK